MVESGGLVAAIPLDAVSRTMRLKCDEIAFSGGRRFIRALGQDVPFVDLSSALGRKASANTKRSSWPCVFISGRSRRLAVGVDRLFGTDAVLVRSLPVLTGVQMLIAGASLNAEGNPQIVLDPEGLIQFAEEVDPAGSTTPGAIAPPLLIVDDSLTTRMVEQSILESAGYRVDLATSGQEALEKARRQRYGLFLVDVEMPGMDGFEFIAKTRADPLLHEIPSILVTSRNSADDRRRVRRRDVAPTSSKASLTRIIFLKPSND